MVEFESTMGPAEEPSLDTPGLHHGHEFDVPSIDLNKKILSLNSFEFNKNLNFIEKFDFPKHPLSEKSLLIPLKLPFSELLESDKEAINRSQNAEYVSRLTPLEVAIFSGEGIEQLRMLVETRSDSEPALKKGFQKRTFRGVGVDAGRDLSFDELLERIVDQAITLKGDGEIATNPLNLFPFRARGPVVELVKLLSQSHNLYHLYLYQDAYISEITPSSTAEARSSSALRHLLPALIFQYPPRSVDYLLGTYERLMDYKTHPRGFHPQEHCMAMLLNHPKLSEDPVEAGATLSRITRAITSPYRFIDFKMDKVPPTQLGNWKRLGVLAFSFLTLKHDARRSSDGTTLLNRFGFQNVEVPDGGHKNDSVLNGGVTSLHGRDLAPDILKTLEPSDYQKWQDCTIILSQRALAISAPGFGTLVISNGSPAREGTKLKRLAYYSPRNIEYSDGNTPSSSGSEISLAAIASLTAHIIERRYQINPFKNFSSKEIKDFLSQYANNMKGAIVDHLSDLGLIDNRPDSSYGFVHVLDPSYNQKHRFTFPNSVHSLLRMYDAFLDSYHGWLCETRREVAFSWPNGDESPPLLQGAHLSPGFSTLVKRLREFFDNGEDVPDLGIAPRNLPPWTTFEFEIPEIGPTNRLRIDETTLGYLEKLAAHRLSNEEWRLSGLHSFFNAATENEGILVMLSREE